MVVRFGPFTLDDGARTLHRRTGALHLSPKAFDLLTLLVRRRPDAIAKAEFHQYLWPDTFVSDGNVAVLIAEIRVLCSAIARRNPGMSGQSSALATRFVREWRSLRRRRVRAGNPLHAGSRGGLDVWRLRWERTSWGAIPPPTCVSMPWASPDATP